MKTIQLILILIFVSVSSIKATENNNVFTISGHIKDASNGEELIGATIYVTELKNGTITNLYGFYSLSLPAGNYLLEYSYLGFATISKTIELKQNQTINIEMSADNQAIKEVVVKGESKRDRIIKPEMSMHKVQSQTVKKIPALMGEVDIIKAIQLLPGVQSAGEGFSGFSVRGGSYDQNLILLDEAPVYNASHLMGFFSVFNNDAIKDLKFYKGDIPAAYGGRLSSLLDVRMKEGNNKKIAGSGGIGTISSRLTLEAPIIKDKSSFIVSGRRTYADMFLKAAKDKEVRKNRLYFYDLNTKFNYKINDKNRIFVSGYFGRDVFRFNKEFGLDWGNQTQTVRYNHLFSDKLFSNFTFVHSDYDYKLKMTGDDLSFDWDSELDDLSFKGDLTYYLNPGNTIKFGAATTRHRISPGNVMLSFTEEDTSISFKIAQNRSLEHALYLSNTQKIGTRIMLNYGIRFAMFQNIGKGTIYNYNQSDQPIDTAIYKKGNIYNTYEGLEPRLGVSYMLDEKSSIKASYSRTQQFMHLASNSAVGSPLDVWFPSNPNIKPQIADLVAVGYFRNIDALNTSFDLSIETYYKHMDNTIDFKDHANLILNEHIDADVRTGFSWSYGAEFMLRKNVGDFSGWISYTYSKTQRKINGINDGRSYLAPYDKPHDFSIVLNYDITKRISVGATWVYSTGAPVTAPTGRFTYGNQVGPVYSDRNSYRMPNYHRLDFSFTIKNKEREGRKYFSEWNFSVFNVYNRKNAFMITFEADENNANTTFANKIYMFPIVPSVTYNFHF